MAEQAIPESDERDDSTLADNKATDEREADEADDDQEESTLEDDDDDAADDDSEEDTDEDDDEADEADEDDDSEDDEDEDEGGKPKNDADLEKWAKKAGIDLEDLSPANLRKIAQRFRDTQRKLHTAGRAELRDQVSDIAAQESKEGKPDSRIAALEAKQAKYETKDRVNEWFDTHPALEPFADTMHEILAEKAKTNPKAAANLSEDLDTLAILAKDRLRSTDNSTDRVKNQAKQEERKRLAKRSAATAPKAKASRAGGGSTEITRAEIKEHSDAGDVAWLRKHDAKITKLLVEGRLK